MEIYSEISEEDLGGGTGGGTGGGAVDSSVIDGSPNAVSGNAVFDALALKENAANKSNDPSFFANSSSLFPSQSAVKAYTDSAKAAAIATLRGGVAEDGNDLAKLYALITAINAIIGGTATDGDALVNQVSELLTVFATYPEGTDIAAMINSKVATADVLNALTATVSGKVLDARQGKILAAALNALDNAVYAALDAKQDQIGYIPENTANKSNDTSFAADSATLFPTQHSVKVLVTNQANAASDKAVSDLRDGVAPAGDTLSKLYALIGAINAVIGGTTADGDALVNQVSELLAVFSTYPEGVNIANLIAAKVNTSDVLNALTQTASGKVLDARQGKILADALNALDNAVYTALDTKQDLLGFTPENVANKSTDGTFAANSATLFPSQSAVKTYADNLASAKLNASDVYNALDRTTGGKALDARQGKTLSDSVISLSTTVSQKANDSAVVKLTGVQSIGGAKTFTDTPVVPDDSYVEGKWNGSLEVPTKNAVRDEFESLRAALNSIIAIVGAGVTDGDAFVNTVTELLSIFATYPEGVDILTALNGKINTSSIVNTLTETASGKVLDARQGKILADALGALDNAVYTALDGKQDLLGYVPENTANKSNDGTFFSNSSSLFPTQQASKTYTDNAKTAAIATIRNSVASAGDDLAKLYALISANKLENYVNRSYKATHFDFFKDFENGLEGLTANLSGTSASINPVSADAANHPGVVRATTGSTSSGIASALSAASCIQLGGGSVSIESLLKIITSSSGLQSYSFAFGLIDTVTGIDQTDGCYFLYDPNSNAAGSLATGNVVCVTSSNSTRALTDSSVSIAGSWSRLRIEVNAAATSVSFYIDNALVATHTTNIPSGTGRELGFGWHLQKFNGTTGRSVDFDFISVQSMFTTAR